MLQASFGLLKYVQSVFERKPNAQLQIRAFESRQTPVSCMPRSRAQPLKVFLFRTQMILRTLQLDISTTDIIKEIDDFSSNIVARKTKRIRGVAEVTMRKLKRCNRLG